MQTYPHWVPKDAIQYINHIETGVPIRELARRAGCHPSTISRTIQKYERWREDPLVDTALSRLQHANSGPNSTHITRKTLHKSDPKDPNFAPVSSYRLSSESPYVLRQLCEYGVVLVVSLDMPNGILMSEIEDREVSNRITIDRALAEAMALKGWISCKVSSRVLRYKITPSGRVILHKFVTELGLNPDTLLQSSSIEHVFGDHDDIIKFTIDDDPVRPTIEPPLVGLARRKDKDGEPFLNNDLILAGERLREDFELAELASQGAINWSEVINETAKAGDYIPKAATPTNPLERIRHALSELGSGLGEVTISCCCFLEGLEAIEKRMGWSARSGKVVLRIALQRLHRHYIECGKDSAMIK